MDDQTNTIDAMKYVYALYPVTAVLHFLLSTGLGKTYFWLGDVYLLVMGVGLVWITDRFWQTQPDKAGMVYMSLSLVRMLLGLAVVVLPLAVKQPAGYRTDALVFVGLFVAQIAVETAVLVRLLRTR